MTAYLPIEESNLAAVVRAACPHNEDEIRSADYSQFSQGGLLKLLEITLDNLDALDVHVSALSALKQKLKDALLADLEKNEVEKASSGRLSVSVTTQDTVKITGDWEQVQKDLINVGLGYVCTKKLAPKKLMDAFIDGTPMPEGIEFGEFKKLNHRRKKA
jgi:hypothetical protein